MKDSLAHLSYYTILAVISLTLYMEKDGEMERGGEAGERIAHTLSTYTIPSAISFTAVDRE